MSINGPQICYVVSFTTLEAVPKIRSVLIQITAFLDFLCELLLALPSPLGGCELLAVGIERVSHRLER